MTYKHLKLEAFDPGIQVVKISRPKALNALNSEVLNELKNALKEISTNLAVRVAILTGDGEKAFIAGADIEEMRDKTPSSGTAFAKLGHEVTRLLETMPQPTIAAVNGFALGGGCEMAIACDFIIASDSAVFGQPEVGLGICPGYGATARLAKFVGLPQAKELIFTGRKIKAAEAKEMGLVTLLFPKEGFFEKALEVARVIAQNSFTAVSASKRLLNEFSETTGMGYKLDVEAQEFGGLFGTPDQREGMGAFLEKRKPKF